MSNTPRIGVFNMTLPAEGPVCIPENVDFSGQTEKTLDFTQSINDGVISFITGAWIDNSENAQELIIEAQGTFQRVKFPASKQGFIQLFSTNPPVFNLSQAAAGGTVRLIFTNFPVFPYIIGN